MTISLEQELEQLISSQDYCITIHNSDTYLRIKVLYLPKLKVKGEGGFSYIANGQVGEERFGGRPRKRYSKARKWVIATIEGHRELLKAVQQA